MFAFTFLGACVFFPISMHALGVLLFCFLYSVLMWLHTFRNHYLKYRKNVCVHWPNQRSREDKKWPQKGGSRTSRQGMDAECLWDLWTCMKTAKDDTSCQWRWARRWQLASQCLIAFGDYKQLCEVTTCGEDSMGRNGLCSLGSFPCVCVDSKKSLSSSSSLVGCVTRDTSIHFSGYQCP